MSVTCNVSFLFKRWLVSDLHTDTEKSHQMYQLHSVWKCCKYCLEKNVDNNKNIVRYVVKWCCDFQTLLLYVFISSDFTLDICEYGNYCVILNIIWLLILYRYNNNDSAIFKTYALYYNCLLKHYHFFRR